jgi:hypothetical protein
MTTVYTLVLCRCKNLHAWRVASDTSKPVGTDRIHIPATKCPVCGCVPVTMSYPGPGDELSPLVNSRCA